MGKRANLPPCSFSHDNSQTVKAVNVSLIDFSLETLMPNLVSLTCSSLQILDKYQRGQPQKITFTFCRCIMTPLLFSSFITNLKISASLIPDVWSINFKLLLITTFYLTKTESRIRKILTQLSYYCFE